MRILMVNKYLYPRAGAETYMLNVCRELVRDGHEVALFGMAHPENVSAYRSETFDFLSFDRLQGSLSLARNLLKAARQLATGEVRKKLRALVGAFRPHVIHAHNVYNQLSPGLFLEYAGSIPVVMTVHDFKAVCPNYSLYTNGENCVRCLGGNYFNCVRHRCVHGSLLKSTLAALSSAWHRSRGTYKNGYSRLIAPSYFMRAKLVEGGVPAGMVCLLNNFAQLPEEKSPPGRGILYAGRLCREKGVDVLLEAYSKLPSPRPTLVIAGRGPSERVLKDNATMKKLFEIEWLGHVQPEEVEARLKKCAVSVVPSSWYENCSMSILESLVRGRACIVSDSGGNPELVENGKTGWLFEAGNSGSLHEALCRFIDTPSEELCSMAADARALAEKRFCPDVHMKQLYEIYAVCVESCEKQLD